MNCQINEEVADEIRDMYLDFMNKDEFGEFWVKLTVNLGVPVKMTESKRRNITRYKSEKIIQKKQEGK
ncbi:hypothetical protein [Treponema sp. C6A8]|uniref:hypothetical protein n=1 Tax=Treponema sp. C6A8 TaxID=1410609 RepID=UPI00048319A9|nr:hypothetical protein [Treponema sp. C6A8]